jgi:ABC-type antimicrobial peptide transport system permease subunit
VSTIKLIINNLIYYRRQALITLTGMAIGMAVITGALVTGDSVKLGLRKLVEIRLGETDLAVTTGDRFITDSLAIRLSGILETPAAAVLELQGSASSGGGALRVPNVTILGIDPEFRKVAGQNTFELPAGDNDIVISDNLAARLDVKPGDEIILRISKPGPVPVDAPFVSDEGSIVSIPLTICALAGKESLGRFHLRNTQAAPLNIFISRKRLQKLAESPGLSNLILLSGEGKISVHQTEQALAQCRTARDAGLDIRRHPATGEWLVRTPGVFFDLPTLAALDAVAESKSRWFSYFINEIRSGSLATPYSFVSTLPGNAVMPGEVIISRWLADDLGVKPGDSLAMSYFMVGPLRNLTEEKRSFRIAEILPDSDPAHDRLLMPEIPGLSDAGNCRDWETGIPIDLDRIRTKDEEYWEQYRGTPKAWINEAEAVGMWQNRFGSYTQVRFPAAMDAGQIEKAVLASLRPSDTGITVRNIASEGLSAASSGVDFSGLFLGLSFFLIAGGIILSALLVRLGLESRAGQSGTLRSLGWPENKVLGMLLAENFLIAVAGAIAGLALTWLYCRLVFLALGGVWNSIVLTDTLEPVFLPATLLAGAALSILLSGGIAWFVIARFFRRKPIDLIRKSGARKSKHMRMVYSGFSGVAGAASLVMLAIGLLRLSATGPIWFFGSGTLMLISAILVSIHLFRVTKTIPAATFTLAAIGRSNLARNGSRSLSIVLLFSIGVFMVIAIGANRKGEEGDGLLSGTGGFAFYVETTAPVADNLGSPAVRARYGLESTASFVQMKRLDGDDASCLNLNRVSNPALLGVPEGAFAGRFSFVSLADEAFRDDPWAILEAATDDGLVPAIADQTVIQWGLGLKTGDTLNYLAGNGDTVRVRLVGGLANSIFQGSLLIPERAFSTWWPSASGSRVMLVTAAPSERELAGSEIMNLFRDYGPDMKTASSRLAEFNSVENTYLSIFLIMGALAMLLGTFGLAVIVARNLLERKAEIAFMRSAGFSQRRVFGLIVGEYSTLLLLGTLAGGIPGLVAVLPAVVGPAGEVSPLFLLSILAVLLLNGLFWIAALAWHAVRKRATAQSLRPE